MFDIFVRYGYRPTVSTFDTKMRLPDESCTQLSYNSTDGCSPGAYKVQLSDEVIDKPGTYFLGVHYEGSSENASRRRRDYDPATDMNYTMSVLQEQCLSWNSTEEQWSSHGCRVSFIFCYFGGEFMLQKKIGLSSVYLKILLYLSPAGFTHLSKLTPSKKESKADSLS